MIKKIASTTATRLIAAIISLIIVVLNSRNIGPVGVGTIGIIILDITIISAISGFFGGPSFVYFTPRKSIKNLLPVSIISSFIGPIIFLGFYYISLLFFDFSSILAPPLYLRHIIALSIIMILYSNNMAIILGREKIYIHNLLTVIQFVIVISSLLYFFYIKEEYSVLAYIKSYYYGVTTGFVLSLMVVIKESKQDQKSEPLDLKFLKEILSYGAIVQLASLFQVFNYRMPYYFLQAFFPSGSQLGVFTVGTQLSEGLWIVGKSVSMVQYSKISNTNDAKFNSNLTISLLKFAIIITTLLIILLLLIPVQFYIYVFHFEQFGQIKQVILYLSPGIIALSGNMILSHYLSGIGKPIYNMIVSFIGLIIIIFTGYYLISNFGLNGAAIATSITYITTFLLSSFFYFSHSDSFLSDLKLTKKDFELFRKISRELMGQKK